MRKKRTRQDSVTDTRVGSSKKVEHDIKRAHFAKIKERDRINYKTIQYGRTFLPNEGLNEYYMIGGLFLKHFYTVYDLDKDEVSLGINTHSKGKAYMYAPGKRPADIDKKFSLSEIKIDSMDDYMARIGESYDQFDLQEYMAYNYDINTSRVNGKAPKLTQLSV